MSDRLTALHVILRLLTLVVWTLGVTATIFYFAHDGVAAFVEHLAGWGS